MPIWTNGYWSEFLLAETTATYKLDTPDPQQNQKFLLTSGKRVHVSLFQDDKDDSILLQFVIQMVIFCRFFCKVMLCSFPTEYWVMFASPFRYFGF